MATNVGNKLYAWENNSGNVVYTNTLTITDSNGMTINNGGTIIYNSTGSTISFVISHTNNSITKTSHGGGTND